MNKFLTSYWMTLPASVVVYLLSTVLFWKQPANLKDAIAGIQAIKPKPSFWEFSNPEAEQLIAELKSEKRSLDKREHDLNDLAARLEAERSEVGLVTQTVHQMQVDFDKNVLRVTEEETANLKKLAKVYAAMEPDAAANVLAQQDDTSIAKIMVYMKDSDTAAIFEAFAKKGAAEAKRASALSERLRLSISRNTTAK